MLDLDGNSYPVSVTQIDRSMIIITLTELDNIPSNNTCVYIKVKKTTGGMIKPSYEYSDIMVYTSDTEGISKVRYRCNEDAFGFPFSKLPYPLVTWLPINIKRPQFQQEDKSYVKSNGEVVILSAKYYKEWEAESDYIPEDMHSSIVAVLACDEVYLDGVRLTKSDSYDINWDNTIKACGQKLAKATWKMRANITERNSNC